MHLRRLVFVLLAAFPVPGAAAAADVLSLELLGRYADYVSTHLSACSVYVSAQQSPPYLSGSDAVPSGFNSQVCQAEVLGRRVEIALAYSAFGRVFAWTVMFPTGLNRADAQKLFYQVSMQLRRSFPQYTEERLSNAFRRNFVAPNRALASATLALAEASGAQLVARVESVSSAAEEPWRAKSGEQYNLNSTLPNLKPGGP